MRFKNKIILFGEVKKKKKFKNVAPNQREIPRDTRYICTT